MLKVWRCLQAALVLGGALLAGAAGKLALPPRSLDLAGMLGCAGFILAGLDIMLVRRDYRYFGIRLVESYSGGAAWLRGLAFLAPSVVFFCWFAARFFGLEEALLAVIKARPSLPVLAAGLAIAGAGGSFWLGSDLTQQQPPLRFGNRLSGGILLILGAPLVALGLLGILAPTAFGALVGALRWWAVHGITAFLGVAPPLTPPASTNRLHPRPGRAL